MDTARQPDGVVYRRGDCELESSATHHAGRPTELFRPGDHDSADVARRLPLGAAATERLAARSFGCSASSCRFRITRPSAGGPEVEQWVTGTSEAPAPAEKPRPARLTIDLDPELHLRFKSACVLRRTTMVDEVRAFIEKSVAG